MTVIRKRQRARLYIYKKGQMRNVFIYKNPDTLQKARQFTLRCYIKNPYTLSCAIFCEMFEVGIYIQNALINRRWCYNY